MSYIVACPICDFEVWKDHAYSEDMEAADQELRDHLPIHTKDELCDAIIKKGC